MAVSKDDQLYAKVAGQPAVAASLGPADQAEYGRIFPTEQAAALSSADEQLYAKVSGSPGTER